jgi:hypothetical protein
VHEIKFLGKGCSQRGLTGTRFSQNQDTWCWLVDIVDEILLCASYKIVVYQALARQHFEVRTLHHFDQVVLLFERLTESFTVECISSATLLLASIFSLQDLVLKHATVTIFFLKRIFGAEETLLSVDGLELLPEHDFTHLLVIGLARNELLFDERTLTPLNRKLSSLFVTLIITAVSRCIVGVLIHVVDVHKENLALFGEERDLLEDQSPLQDRVVAT